ncbi:MAG TPA: YncE family protein [Candidatus Krumholzibacteria bacterium]|nr:YncE family protein [Candidatus Krumholzibacteria bacterium]
MKRILVLVLVCCLWGSVSRATDDAAPWARVANRFSVEGDGGWDLLTVDEAGGRVFLSHGTVVQAVDEKTGKLLGTIGGMDRVHGIALAPDLKLGFATSGADNMVVIFDTGSLAVITKLPVDGTSPDAILYDPATKRVFAFNGHSNNATVIDAKTRAIAGSVALPGKPELAVADGRGGVFVNLEDTSMVCAIDAKAMKVKTAWSLAPGKEPTGLAIDAKNHRLFSACNNGFMVVLDSESGKVVATVPIGERVDGAAFDPALKRAYAPCGTGSLTVIQETNANTFSVLENTPTQIGARTIAIDTRTHHLFQPTAEYGEAPAPTAENAHPRPPIKPGTFVLLDVEARTK